SPALRSARLSVSRSSSSSSTSGCNDHRFLLQLRVLPNAPAEGGSGRRRLHAFTGERATRAALSPFFFRTEPNPERGTRNPSQLRPDLPEIGKNRRHQRRRQILRPTRSARSDL